MLDLAEEKVKKMCFSKSIAEQSFWKKYFAMGSKTIAKMTLQLQNLSNLFGKVY